MYFFLLESRNECSTFECRTFRPLEFFLVHINKLCRTAKKQDCREAGSGHSGCLGVNALGQWLSFIPGWHCLPSIDSTDSLLLLPI